MYSCFIFFRRLTKCSWYFQTIIHIGFLIKFLPILVCIMSTVYMGPCFLPFFYLLDHNDQVDQKWLPIFTIHNKILLRRLIQSLRTKVYGMSMHLTVPIIHNSWTIDTIGTLLHYDYFALKTLLVCRKVLFSIDLYKRRPLNNP